MSSERLSDSEQESAEKRALELFDSGQQAYRNRKFEEAFEAFTAAEHTAREVERTASWRISVRVRQGTSLVQLGRWKDALAIIDGLVADLDKLKAADADHYLRERYPDELAAVYWSRMICLDELERFTEIPEAFSSLIDEVGSGSTPAQRSWLAGGHLLQAKAVAVGGDPARAHKAIDAALNLCSQHNEPWVADKRLEAQNMRKSVDTHQSQDGKLRSLLRGVTKRRLN